jgi:hypothetical protein
MIAVACGGASEQDVLSTSSSASSSGASSGATASSSGATSSGGTTSSGSSGGGSTIDAGPSPPTGTCTRETELNNEPGDANELQGSVCGSLLPSSELDFLTFTLKQGTKTMDFTFRGDVKITIVVEGHEKVELSPSSNPPIPFVVGEPYIVRISANSGPAAKVEWRVNLVTTQ